MTTSTVNSLLADSSPIDWSGVRPVYQKLHQDFSILTQPFGITITGSLDHDLAYLICAIDVIDRVLDDLESPTERRQLSNAIVKFIAGKGAGVELRRSSTELISRMRCLRNVIVRREIQAEFAQTAEQIFFHTESKRNASDPKVMVKHLNAEWKLSGELTILILGQTSNRRFENFFELCCETMTVVDMVRDANQDYANGQLSFRPGVLFYLRMILSFLFRLPKLLVRFPKRLMLLRYAASFIWQSR